MTNAHQNDRTFSEEDNLLHLEQLFSDLAIFHSDTGFRTCADNCVLITDDLWVFQGKKMSRFVLFFFLPKDICSP